MNMREEKEEKLDVLWRVAFCMETLHNILPDCYADCRVGMGPSMESSHVHVAYVERASHRLICELSVSNSESILDVFVCGTYEETVRSYALRGVAAEFDLRYRETDEDGETTAPSSSAASP